MNTKQVLIWNKSLRNTDGHKLRTGKIAAQLSHASMKALLDQSYVFEWERGEPILHINLFDKAIRDWVQGIFTKVCVGCDSEEELLALHAQAKEAGLLCSLIQDVGLTEFGGVATYTAVGIGPAESDDIDKITGGLKLL